MSATPVAVLGIGEVASMGLAAQIVDPGGSLAALRAEVEDSAHWPEFVALVAAGQVDETCLAGPLGVAVVGWARQAAGL